MRVGVKGFTFDSAHYTRGSSQTCLSLHGHTFTLDVEIEGEVDAKTGMVLDFTVLKKIVKKVLKKYDHKLIVPKKDLDKLVLSGPFLKNVKAIEFPEATTEYLALEIVKDLHEKLKMKVKVRLYEGVQNYVEAEYP
ncbi:TPA: 6-pyruvoyl tetrahydropterin synthase family protein [Candidatus Bathyarchaeota archaeon]|nr:6-pyruvoyl tetrahydropterin synthase family protein [Candidatus Bathyarchaeota archaeon]